MNNLKKKNYLDLDIKYRIAETARSTYWIRSCFDTFVVNYIV